MIYVDLDNTLIDSARRLRYEISIAERYGVSRETYWRAVDIFHERYAISAVRFELLFECCRVLIPDLSEVILEEWNALLRTPYFFPDTHDFLSAFEPKDLALLTTGYPEFQKIKIATHGLERYFSEIHIVGSPKCRHISPPKNSVFIDDAAREIDATKKYIPDAYCIFVREPIEWEKQKFSLLRDAYCNDLFEAKDHIKKLDPRI